MSRDELATARAWLAEATRPVSFSGAGLSAESGVPTFRDAATGGLWSAFDPMRLASPEGFAAEPDLVLAWYAWRRQAVARAEPNAAHRALAARRDVRHVTQNVDDLLERAGARDVLHLHGTIGDDRCHGGCGHREPVDCGAEPAQRPCPRCGAPLRPAVVWFGEALPGDVWRAAETACRDADLLLVIGTSAVVHPAAGLIDVAGAAGARIVVVNPDASAADGVADLVVRGRAGDVVPGMLGERK